MSELLTNMFKFEKEVKTVNGLKLVVAHSEEALASAVVAAESEAKLVSPDINNPEHANVPATAFMGAVPVAPAEVEPEVEPEPEVVAPPKRSHSKKVVE